MYDMPTKALVPAASRPYDPLELAIMDLGIDDTRIVEFGHPLANNAVKFDIGATLQAPFPALS